MQHRRAFTLVELSIVLVILGLLVGGVLAGQSLIRAAELRSVTTQYNQYIAATQSFRDKYFALPGDMTNAQSFWGVAHATPATCQVTVGTGTQTCNGDGNGYVTDSPSENFRYWQHLANAGLIEGSYTGVRGTASGSPTDVTVQNTPSGKIASTSWLTLSLTTTAGNASRGLFVGPYDNFYMLGRRVDSAAWNYGETFSPAEVWNIDKKIDDDRPAYGKVRVALFYMNSSGTRIYGCTSTSDYTDVTATYSLNNSSPMCIILFPQAF